MKSLIPSLLRNCSREGGLQFTLGKVMIWVLVILSVVAPLTLAAPDGLGEPLDPRLERLKQIQAEQERLRKQIAEAQYQERTLANQIEYFDNQIRLTQLAIEETEGRITQTQAQLAAVSQDIEVLQTKLDNLDESVRELTTVLRARIRASYQATRISPLTVFLASGSFQDAIRRLSYLEILQKEDKRLLQQMQQTQSLYLQQKSDLERFKKEKESLKAQLESQKALLKQQQANLTDQKASKEYLLEVTQNQESKYQQLLAQTEEEIRAIKEALRSLGTKLGEVKQGDVIAHVGNTGCSTGPHLHFGYYVNGVAIDPLPLLQSGKLAWPLANPQITQTFNDPRTRSWYQSFFGMSGHNGIDMVDELLGSGAPIYAAADGVAYAVHDSRACSLTGTVGRGIRIDHPDGTKTIYWHVQPSG